jgi:predicted DCC family thiol-disulfide oxidoreductase YuxK
MNSKKIRLLLLGVSVLIAYLLASFNPAAAQPGEVKEVQTRAMVKNMPFPFEDGVAVRSARWQLMTQNLIAADTLRAQSERTINSLKTGITADSVSLVKLKSLSGYNAHKADSLSREMSVKQDSLDKSEANLTLATGVIERIVGKLPRGLRKVVVLLPLEKQATAICDYIATLRWRKWYWFGTGIPVGAAALLFLKAAIR